jgi:hypothetical protein
MIENIKKAWRKFIKRYIIDKCPKELNDLF